MTEGTIAAALAAHHCGDEWAFLTQVRNQTGYSRTIRTADAMALSLWPSRGLYATGYEIKISKSDLKKELAEPAKAEEIGRFCRLWFIATPEGLCVPGELPLNWGLVELKENGKLKWTKPAVPNMEAQEPTWRFVCSIARNIGDSSVPKCDFEARVNREKEELRKSLKNSEGYEMRSLRSELSELRKMVTEFESQSGVKIDKYSDYFNGEIGKAVAVLRQYHQQPPIAKLESMRDGAKRIADDISEVLENIQVSGGI